MSLLVFSKNRTNRLPYVLDVVLKQLLGLDYQLTTDPDLFQRDSRPKLNHGEKRISADEFRIPAHPLLSEKNIREQNIEIFTHADLPAFFKKPSPGADLPFDLFAMCFYLLSRYEEYLPFEKDRHGRFPAGESLAYKSGFLRLPLINLWAKKLGELLSKKFPGLPIKMPVYQCQPTYDIDQAWAYLHKGLLRNSGGALLDLGKMNFHALSERIKVLSGQKKDPFFTFDYLDGLHEKFGLRPIYFFLAADYGKKDKNIPASNPAFQKLIKHISSKYAVGLHPSYRSNFQNDYVEKEKRRLEKIAGHPVSKSRQHFLILEFPKTYRTLIKAGIREDHSMGYASDIGFRAGTATPFYWYDLENERVTELLVHPFQVMDVTLRQYLNLSPTEACDQVSPLIQNCKNAGGTFTTLWHNNSLADEGEWKGWQSAYQNIVEMAL